MLKLLTVWITTNWKILQEMGILDHLTFLLRNLYADQEATDRNGHGTMDWIQIGKGVHQAVYCHLAYLTSMQKCQTGNSTSWNQDWGRNINNLRYADDITLWQKVKSN